MPSVRIRRIAARLLGQHPNGSRHLHSLVDRRDTGECPCLPVHKLSSAGTTLPTGRKRARSSEAMAAWRQPPGSLAAPYLYDVGARAAYLGTNPCINRRHSAAFVIDPGAMAESAADRPGAKARADARSARVAAGDRPPFRRSSNGTAKWPASGFASRRTIIFAVASISTRSETWFPVDTAVDTAPSDTSASALERTSAARSPAQPSIPARVAMATSNRA